MDDYVNTAVRIAGGQRALAKQIGMSHSAVWKWVHNKRVPVQHCEKVSILAQGLISPRQLNPEYKPF